MKTFWESNSVMLSSNPWILQLKQLFWIPFEQSAQRFFRWVVPKHLIWTFIRWISEHLLRFPLTLSNWGMLSTHRVEPAVLSLMELKRKPWLLCLSRYEKQRFCGVQLGSDRENAFNICDHVNTTWSYRRGRIVASNWSACATLIRYDFLDRLDGGTQSSHVRFLVFQNVISFFHFLASNQPTSQHENYCNISCLCEG